MSVEPEDQEVLFAGEAKNFPILRLGTLGMGYCPDVPVTATTILLNTWVSRHAPTAQIEEIMSLATAVIGDKDKAQRWLSEPNIALDEKSPIDLIGEAEGYERVKDLLFRIEFGVLA